MYRYVGPPEIAARAVGSRAVIATRGDLAAWVEASDEEVNGFVKATGYCPEPSSRPALDRLGVQHLGGFTAACGTLDAIKDAWFACGVCGVCDVCGGAL